MPLFKIVLFLLLLQAVALNPLFIKGHYRMGRALLEMEQYDEALQAFDEALKLKPDVPEVVKFRELTEEQARAAATIAASATAVAAAEAPPHVPATPMASRSAAPVYVQSPGGTVSEMQHRCMYCDCIMIFDTLAGDHADACPRSHLSTLKRLLPESDVRLRYV
jgi:tetratricopeptide (TPR) repeat protein